MAEHTTIKTEPALDDMRKALDNAKSLIVKVNNASAMVANSKGPALFGANLNRPANHEKLIVALNLLEEYSAKIELLAAQYKQGKGNMGQANNLSHTAPAV